jgi:hypothetical protein
MAGMLRQEPSAVGNYQNLEAYGIQAECVCAVARRHGKCRGG